MFGAVSAGAFFAFNCCALTAGFIFCLLFAVFRRGYGLKKRVWFIALAAVCRTAVFFRARILDETDLSPLIFCAGILFCLPLLYIPVKSGSCVTDDEDRRREFVRDLDEKIRGNDALPNTAENPTLKDRYVFRERQETETLKADAMPPRQSEDLDFSHVKNVLQRLENALLTPNDRKQMRDLEVALYAAERGDDGEDIKNRINEGLGNLLKIMAKHGV